MGTTATNLVRLKSASGVLSDLVMYEHHLAARHRSPRTLESYRLTLEQFDRFLTDAEHTRPTEDVTGHHVTAFLVKLAGDGAGVTRPTERLSPDLGRYSTLPPTPPPAFSHGRRGNSTQRC